MSRIDFDVAASRAAILDDAYLRGDVLLHGIGVADDAHLLALFRLEHGQRVDDRGQSLGIEGAEAFVDKQVLERDVA